MSREYLTGLIFIMILGGCARQPVGTQTDSAESPAAFSKQDIHSTQKLYGLAFGDQQIDTMYPYLQRNASAYDSLRAYTIPDAVMPALTLDIHPRGYVIPDGPDSLLISLPQHVTRPESDHEIAFLSITELAALLRTDQLNSVELTELYLDRLSRYNPTLQCAISITKELALTQAKQADEELAAGLDRGLLHGIPYGVKDLVSVRSYPTTWGAQPYQDQVIDHNATIIKKLEDAGAVLVAKLVSGALARGDVWYGGQTMNPWDTLQGASGSSAGSASATAAGLVGFSIGTETLGSITSPSTRCGVTGLRPTYGTVSRDGVMSLSWSMDKVGPICRSAQDCAIVYEAIKGKDPADQTTTEAPLHYRSNVDITSLRIACLSSLIEKDTIESGDQIRSSLALLQSQGIVIDSLSLPTDFPYDVFDVILRAEAGAFFDELVRSGDVDMMVQQTMRSRANSLRQARFIPAVEYIQANRFRTMLIEEMHELMKEYDVVITPTFGGRQLMITNLTGHPVVTVPTGFDDDGHPMSISFLGQLYGEGDILSFAHYFQGITDNHKMIPPLFGE